MVRAQCQAQTQIIQNGLLFHSDFSYYFRRATGVGWGPPVADVPSPVRVAGGDRGGGTTQAVAWGFSNAPEDAQLRQQVVAQVEAAADDLTAATGTAPLLIGKSLGSLSAPVAADRALQRCGSPRCSGTSRR